MAKSNVLTENIKKKGIKQKAIAEKLNISTTSLNNKLSGKTKFYVDEALTLLDILDISYSEVKDFFA